MAYYRKPNKNAAVRKNSKKTIGVAIRTARERAGISQEELADRALIDRTYVSQLERDLKSPTVAVLGRIARALGTSLTALMRGIS